MGASISGMTELGRHVHDVAAELLTGFRALVVNGPRQSGKSTLVRQLLDGRPVVNLDDATTLDVARSDPVGFVDQLQTGAAIDEFQRGGDALLLALKARLDLDPSPGQFVLAGSTQFLAQRTISETLTGRIGLLELLPLSAGEIRGRRERFIDAAFAQHSLDLEVERLTRLDYAEALVAGGFPELVLGPSSSRFRSTWCESYLRTVTAAANVEPVASVRKPMLLAELVVQVAARAGGEIIPADLARDVLADAATVASYVDVLSTLYLLRPLPAWTTNETTRAKRRSVAHLIDTALAAHVVGAGTSDDLARLDSPWFGRLLETYVVNELSKQATWTDTPVRLRHFRDRDQREIDIVLERGRRCRRDRGQSHGEPGDIARPSPGVPS